MRNRYLGSLLQYFIKERIEILETSSIFNQVNDLIIYLYLFDNSYFRYPRKMSRDDPNRDPDPAWFLTNWLSGSVIQDIRIRGSGYLRNIYGSGTQWASNGTRLSARCHFTGLQKLSISRAQPAPTCPGNGCCPHQKQYARGRIYHRCINSYFDPWIRIFSIPDPKSRKNRIPDPDPQHWFFLHKRYFLLTQHVHEEVVEVAIQDVPCHGVVLVRYLKTERWKI